MITLKNGDLLTSDLQDFRVDEVFNINQKQGTALIRVKLE